MTQLSLTLSLRARDEGIKRAAEHAGDEWMRLAVEDFVRFLKANGPSPLERWRWDWLGRRMPQPPSHKAYGAVATVAGKRGLVRWTGRYVQAASKKTHGHPVKTWKAI